MSVTFLAFAEEKKRQEDDAKGARLVTERGGRAGPAEGGETP